MRGNTIRKEAIPDWVQLYKKLENRHQNTMRRNPWSSVQKTRGGVDYPPQRDLRASLAGKSVASNIMKPRDDLLLPRQPMMNYFYDKKPERTPKQQLNIARLSYPSLNSMLQGSTISNLVQHYKNSNFLGQQISQSRTQLKKQSSINGNLDKKSIIRGVPYNTFYNTYRPIQPTWYNPYQQQYMRSLIPAGFASSLNSYYNSQFYPTRMNSNPSLYPKSYIANNNMKLAVKKAFIPRSNIQAISKPKEGILLPESTITKNVPTVIQSTQINIHNKTSINKLEFVPSDNSVRKNKTISPTSPTTNNTNVVSVIQKRRNGVIHNGSASHQTVTRTTNNTLIKSPFKKTLNKTTTIIKPSDAHYILSKKNRTRHFFHKTDATKSANKRGFLSSPEEFEDEVGEFPMEEDPKTESTSEGIDSLNTLDQDQGELQQPGSFNNYLYS